MGATARIRRLRRTKFIRALARAKTTGEVEAPGVMRELAELAIHLWHNEMYEEDPPRRRPAVAERQVSLRRQDRY
jgi:hypothetical protein